MHLHEPLPPSVGKARPLLEVADIFRAHGQAYRQVHVLRPEERAAMRAIEACRTQVLGGHVDVCTACDFSRPAYNSCRNRHCPKCQALTQAAWIDQRMERVLPTHYFHVVFTLPQELRRLAIHNRDAIFDLLFASVASTLLTLGKDEQRLGAQLGLTAVLHTWTRDLRFHPHVHCIVTGGGLAPARDRWISCRQKYLFPVRVLSKLFRGKFLDGLAHAYQRGELDLSGLADPGEFEDLIGKLHRKPWVVYAKRPFAGPDQVFQYLGQYTHRVGLSNHRLVSFDERGVCFRTKDGKAATLSPEEFIRRFLLHVLPANFVKIRHYGILASGNVRTKLVDARRHLEVKVKAEELPRREQSWKDQLFALTGLDLTSCPRCSGEMIRRPLDERPFHLLGARSSPSPTSPDTS